jgi:hypothetical protein
MGFLFALAVLVGPVGNAMGGSPDVGTYGFPFLFSAIGLLLGLLGKEAERLVFGIKQRPWLGGQRRRRQLLLLPYGTAAILGGGFSLTAPGITVLANAPAGWSPLTIGAAASMVAGAALTGFALSRLAAGLLILHRSGLWDARRRDWLLGAAAVAVGTTACVLHAVATVLGAVSGA